MRKPAILSEEDLLESHVCRIMDIGMLMDLIKNAKKRRSNIQYITITPKDEIGLIDEDLNLIGFISLSSGKSTFFDEKDFVTLMPID